MPEGIFPVNDSSRLNSSDICPKEKYISWLVQNKVVAIHP
jgi:hypothetical protein